MAYDRNEIFSPYERFSAKVPVLPQILFMGFLGYVAVRAGIATLDGYLEALTAAGGINMVTKFDIGGVLQEPFVSAAKNLAGSLALIIAAFMVMRNLPLFHEVGRQRAAGGLGKAYENFLAAFSAIVLLGFSLIFVAWTAYLSFVLFIPALAGTLMNMFVVPVVTLAVIGTYAYALISIARMTFLSDS